MKQLLVVSGMSGAGKSHATGVLEDNGWYVIDNIIPTLIAPIVDFINQPGSNINKVAVVVDTRSGEFFKNTQESLSNLENYEIEKKVLFITASDEELVKRFEKVRRPHPLQENGSILDGIQKEREILKSIEKSADVIIDTTGASIHDTTRKIVEKINSDSRKSLAIHVMSFGFKHGVPLDSELMVDMRFLPNPFWVDDLKEKSGLDKEVSDYVFSFDEASDFIDNLIKTVRVSFDGFLRENKQNLTIAFGCTGGKHRSVATSEAFSKKLSDLGYVVSINHRDINKN